MVNFKAEITADKKTLDETIEKIKLFNTLCDFGEVECDMLDYLFEEYFSKGGVGKLKVFDNELFKCLFKALLNDYVNEFNYLTNETGYANECLGGLIITDYLGDSAFNTKNKKTIYEINKIRITIIHKYSDEKVMYTIIT